VNKNPTPNSHEAPDGDSPAVNVRMTDHHFDQFRKWLATKAQDSWPPCGFCGQSAWEASRVIRAHPTGVPTDKQALALFWPTIASAVIVCRHCGFIMHFDAATVGFAPSLETDRADEG